jgi:NAD(P)-dependent dehydrogenase (short-subunit alcohol dehydrogenase family)
LVLGCDIASTEQVDDAFVRIGDQVGAVDALVNNAGNVSPAPSHAIEDDSWHRLLDIHLGGSMRASRAALRLLLRSPHPSVVNLSSVCAERGFPGRLAYNAAKAAIDSLTRTLATEWGAWGVRVNSVAPGFILTANSAALYDAGLADATARASLTSLRRLGQPREVAEAIYWLASPLSSYVTGHVLVVDGGFLTDGRTGPDSTDVGLEPPWSDMRGA